MCYNLVTFVYFVFKLVVAYTTKGFFGTETFIKERNFRESGVLNVQDLAKKLTNSIKISAEHWLLTL